MAKRKSKKVEEVIEAPPGPRVFRPVPGLQPASWAEGHDYIMHYALPVFMKTIMDALDDGFSPEEIEYQLRRDLPAEKERLAISAKNCAYYILYERGEIEL